MTGNRHMGRTASTVGMMEGAFFVSRTELLQWVNNLLAVSLTKVEQCANGAIYCQILDACHPGTIALRKVNWMAKADHEYIPNYKVLQAAFDRNGIEKYIDVDKLIRAKYQDNLEFLQWMKCYWEREGSRQGGYDPVLARESKPVPLWARGTGGAPMPATSTPRLRPEVHKENVRPQRAAAVSECAGASKASRYMVGGLMGTPPSGNPREAVGGSSGRRTPAAPPPPALMAPAPAAAPASKQVAEMFDKAALDELREQVVSQQEELADLRTTLDGLERERDYYFRKLRDVEMLCNDTQARKKDAMPSSEQLIVSIQNVLYAENDEDDDDVATAAGSSAAIPDNRSDLATTPSSHSARQTLFNEAVIAKQVEA